MSYLSQRGDDLETLNELCDWPTEFLRDPASWLEADKMEDLLRVIEKNYGNRLEEEGLLEAAGHAAKDVRAWGVLDSVLRMVQTPKDLFAQPERLFSYFISPAPPVGDIRREAEKISFVLPVSAEQFPLVTTYLRAAFEALPTYIGRAAASVVWDKSVVTIAWTENQESLFTDGEHQDLSLNPELVDSVRRDLEISQKRLEELKLELRERDREIDALKSVQPPAAAELITKAPIDSVSETEARLATVLHDLYRLGDYFARSQQLITLLIGQGRQTRQVQEAMRRVDWEFVTVEAPRTVRQLVDEVQGLRDTPPKDAQSGKSPHATSASSQRPVQGAFNGLTLDH